MKRVSYADLEKKIRCGDKVKVKFIPEGGASTVELGAQVREITKQYFIISIQRDNGPEKTLAIPIERLCMVEKILPPPIKVDERASKVNFCDRPQITNRFINTIQHKVKWPNGNGEYGDWDGLPRDVRQFLHECAEYMLSLEIVAKEGIELKQALAKARLEREGKTLYEKSSYVCAAYFRRSPPDEPEMGFVINEDVLLDASGKIVYNVYDCQTRDDLGAMTMYVPVSKKVSAADCPEYAVEVLQKLVEALKGKYYTAQSRQYNGDRPSGRMYGIGEAIDLLTDTADRIKKGEYHA